MTTATASEDTDPEEIAEALFRASNRACRDFQWNQANEALEEVIAMEGISDATRIRAYIGVGEIWQQRGPATRSKAAYERALGFSGIAPDLKATAQKGLVAALMKLQQYSEARGVMREILASGGTLSQDDQPVPATVLKELAPEATSPETERAQTQVAIAKTLMYDRNNAEAREEFVKALAMPGLSDLLKAEIQLHIGLTYDNAGDYERARPELLKVLEMPGANDRPAWDGDRMRYIPAREAMLRLRMRNLIPNEKKSLKVLFIGSSHTLRGDLPKLVTQMAESAPADHPRIIAGDYVRMGTSIKMFWDAGDGANTARETIASGPWDVVVFETFFNLSGDEIMEYGTRFADLIRDQKATPVVYQSPLPREAEYPTRFQQYHCDNLALIQSTKAHFAPAVFAWMKYLGSRPTPGQFNFLYDDWIHATPKGAYLSACCIYAAITGHSPVGLAHPGEIAADEAMELQKLAWAAYQEANANFLNLVFER